MTLEEILDAIIEEEGSYYGTPCCECDEFSEDEEQDCVNCYVVSEYIRTHQITLIEE
jgi:hypothetical protein